jgi:hypothetical protein
VLALHALLLPINLWRWAEHRREQAQPDSAETLPWQRRLVP